MPDDFFNSDDVIAECFSCKSTSGNDSTRRGREQPSYGATGHTERHTSSGYRGFRQGSRLHSSRLQI